MIRLLEARLAVSFTTLDLKGANSIKPLSMLSWIKAPWRRKPIGAASSLHPTVYDAMRFLLSHSSIIEAAPLQIYCSALLFSPEESIIRKQHLNQVPKWILRGLINYEHWTPYLQILSHSAAVNSVAFSPDGRLIGSASDDHTIRLWEATTGTERRVFQGHSDSVNIVAFSPDSRLIASASRDHTVRVWDTTTGTERRVFRGHPVLSVNAIAFSPNSQLIASASSGQTFLL